MGAAQQATTSVTGMEAAQGAATKVEGPTARKLETDPVTGESEIISGAANAETAAFTEAKQAEEATPSKQATVQGQLEGLMAQFEGGNTPAWVAGAMRSATNAKSQGSWCIFYSRTGYRTGCYGVCTSYRTNRCCYTGSV